MGWIKDIIRHGLAKRGIENSPTPLSIPPAKSMPKVFAMTTDRDLNTYISILKQIQDIKHKKGLNVSILQGKVYLSPQQREQIEKMFPNMKIMSNGKTILIFSGDKKPNKRPISEQDFKCIHNAIEHLGSGMTYEMDGTLSSEQEATILKNYPSVVIHPPYIVKVEQEEPKEKLKSPCKQTKRLKKVLDKIGDRNPSIKMSPLPQLNYITPLYELEIDGESYRVAEEEPWDLNLMNPTKSDIKYFGLISPLYRDKSLKFVDISSSTMKTNIKNSYWFDRMDGWLLALAGWQIIEKEKHRLRLVSPLTPTDKTSLKTSNNKTLIWTKPVDVPYSFYGVPLGSEDQELMPIGSYKFRRYGNKLLFIPATSKWSNSEDIRYMTTDMVKPYPVISQQIKEKYIEITEEKRQK